MDKTHRDIITRQTVMENKRLAAQSMRRAMTPAEAALWQKLRRSALGGLHFRRQQVIDGFIVDFYCHAKGLIVEVDGGYHQADADRERDAILAARGLKVLRFSNDRVLQDLDSVLAEILAKSNDIGT